MSIKCDSSLWSIGREAAVHLTASPLWLPIYWCWCSSPRRESAAKCGIIRGCEQIMEKMRVALVQRRLWCGCGKNKNPTVDNDYMWFHRAESLPLIVWNNWQNVCFNKTGGKTSNWSWLQTLNFGCSALIGKKSIVFWKMCELVMEGKRLSFCPTLGVGWLMWPPFIYSCIRVWLTLHAGLRAPPAEDNVSSRFHGGFIEQVNSFTAGLICSFLAKLSFSRLSRDIGECRIVIAAFLQQFYCKL